MPIITRLALLLFTPVVLATAFGRSPSAQTLGEPEEFTAIAIVNNELASGAGRVLIRVTRWSTPDERKRLIEAITKEGSESLLDELQDMRSVGTIRTPDTLAYDLRFASQRPAEDGGRHIVLATDRPMTVTTGRSALRRP